MGCSCTTCDHLSNFVQIVELRDCKRSVKKDILEECRVGWQEPEASDDEATHALVAPGMDIRLVPAAGDKFTPDLAVQRARRLARVEGAP